ncbi:thiopeptide-type bacteriocin biosynthesis protein [Catenulispora pinisilvae]|uniref:thiopeptide-type bacteriocin biosynthesis protein n=1 Tax=Catenulispora pinisilvae TaxID=2705253 RepID=UPI0018912C2E|nr:thiopeptide-type bacteriocin biosynthesis protein [Catenulispora pinisilvae]
MTFTAAGRRLTLSELLVQAAAAIEREAGAVDADTARLIDALLGGGVPALRAATGELVWLQYGVTFPPSSRGRVYRAVLDTAGDLLSGGGAEEFFFMHKPPGLRLRFQVHVDRRRALDELIRERLLAWREADMVTAWAPAVYEPESHLFGGPVSMRSVHRIFTADSLAWLNFHCQSHAVGPSWALSLLMIRALFDGLGISGWEDLDVWDRLRWQAGRRLDGEVLAEAGKQLGPSIHGTWNDTTRLLSLLEPESRGIVETYQAAVADVCRGWQAEYFTRPSAHVGPREAAVFVIVFHWNRADLSAARQAAIAEVLAARPGTPAHISAPH